MLDFWLCFVPLFVAVDAVGTLPIFMTLTEGADRAMVRTIVAQSTATALLVALAFLAIGKGLLGLLGITVADFMIAGGILLFVFSLNEMLTFGSRRQYTDAEALGAVPIGVPLIVGPAVLTTTILLDAQFGFTLTALAAALNILIAGILFSFSEQITRVLGKAGAKTVSKLASLILAAIAVMMVRKGIVIFMTQIR